MNSAHDFVLHSRRQLIRITALLVALAAGAALLLVVVLLVVSRGRAGLLPYLGLITLGLAGGVTTFVLVPRRVLWQATLPLAVAIVGAVAISTLFVPEQALIAVPLLTIPVLLMSVGQQRGSALAVAISSAVIAAGLAATAPRPLVPAGLVVLGGVLPLVNAIGSAFLVIVVWLVANRLLAISDAAVALADQRTAEAESARQASEEARATISERAAEQQRLLELIGTLETPAITIADGVLLAPIVGHLDSGRAERLASRLLDAVHRQRAGTVIFDIGGVPMVDTQVAQALVRTAQALHLLGSSVILTGMTTHTALTLSSLGVGLDEFRAVRSPQEALALVAAGPAARPSSRGEGRPRS